MFHIKLTARHVTLTLNAKGNNTFERTSSKPHTHKKVYTPGLLAGSVRPGEGGSSYLKAQSLLSSSTVTSSSKMKANDPSTCTTIIPLKLDR